MPIIDDVKQHVGGVRAAREVPDFIDDQDRRMRVGRERGGKASGAERRREIIDQFGCRHKQCIEPVLDRAVRDGDGEMRFPPTWFTVEDHTVTFRREVRGQRGAEEREPYRGLIHEVEVVNRLEKRKPRSSYYSFESRLLPVRDLFGHE